MPRVFSWSVALAAVLTAPSGSSAGFMTFSVGGNNTPGSIQPTVDAYRLALGNPNNGNAPGPLPSGRREINWDGGGDATTLSATPFAGFQVIRGALFTTPGAGFAQAPLSGGPGGGAAALNPTYATTFGVFSQQRIFSPLGSNITDVTFTIPGNPGQEAAVRGFGAVFTDVDLATSSRIEFYDLNNTLIYSQTVLPGTVPNGSLSFLGAVADAGELIRRVRIISGNVALGPTDNPGGGVDVVAMDDFLFAEPVALPEPTSVTLVLVGAGVMGLARWRRRLRS